jgi:hypothetical protein
VSYEEWVEEVKKRHPDEVDLKPALKIVDFLDDLVEGEPRMFGTAFAGAASLTMERVWKLSRRN